MELAGRSQDILVDWVVISFFVGAASFSLGGAPATGAALVGSSFCSFLAYLLRWEHGGDHLETLVHGAVIAGSVGWPGSASPGFALGTHAPQGRFPMVLVPASGTVAIGILMILHIHAHAPPPCVPLSCFRGFEDPWVEGLLAFNVVFLALLFLVPAWRGGISPLGIETHHDTDHDHHGHQRTTL